jgi:VanZ family protein
VTPAGAGARRARLCLLIFAAFVIYGSFFPFSFRIDADEVRRDLIRFWDTLTLFGPGGRRLFSLADLVSNVLLGVPIGILLVLGRLTGRELPSRLATALVAETLFAGLVEVGQIVAPTRTASALDVLAQVSGALGGALAAHVVGAGALRGREIRLGALARARPALIVVALLAALLAADALYPYALTLDVSTAWGNLKRAQRWPFASFGHRFWGDLLVDRLLPYAVLAFGARLALGGRGPGGLPVSVLVWLGTIGWAVALETGKLLIVGRVPNIDYVILAGLGGGMGLAAYAPLAGTVEARARGPARLAWLTGAHLAYRELTPFDWLGSLDQVLTKAARIEWIPLASYFYADPHSALFDLANKVVWSALFGASLRAAGARAPWRGALALGVGLEALQICQASHVPALTDALAIAAGGWLGARALDDVRRWRARGASTGASVSIARH